MRTLAWLGRVQGIANQPGTASYLIGRANSDGGYAWTKGMPSDAWATFYCTQALKDLGHQIPGRDRTAKWLDLTWSGDAYAMTPGQEPDVWATHFSTRTAVSVCGSDVPDRDRMLVWLSTLQTRSGGLSWSPEHARAGLADVRACHYGVAAWYALRAAGPVAPPWDVHALVRWLVEQQSAEGGFKFSPNAEIPCMWATFRATAALAALGAKPERSVEEWIMGLRGPHGAFVRWAGYDVEDVWASFCAVGALEATGASISAVAEVVVSRFAELACPDGGFTYREPVAAADALTTAAAVLVEGRETPSVLLSRRWLEGCQMPNEGGIMYMPGRGSEVRCTLWAVAAGAFRRNAAGVERVLDWLCRMQNPDGGFGYWEGRGSELVSTAAAVEAVRLLGRDVRSVLNSSTLQGFVDRCRHEDGVGHGASAGATPTLRSGLQAMRVRQALGAANPIAVRALLDRHRVPGGGWANEGSRVPDLLSTYEAVVTADLHGIAVDNKHVGRFIARVRTDAGTAWSPLAPAGGDRLADCLGTLLHKRLDGRQARLAAALTLS
ncbi:prenyltransferase/squalene oxidase repeat-containing protein [Nocardia sp. NPDC052566]|uniref:prenyltransferase/squalene oxidase repeat-containing protein n=1 Tax=Nocardia sp. NPDC052566 TaxID=3364330 RepID=UPI0037CB9442